MKKNFLTAIICAAIFSALFARGAFADETKQPQGGDSGSIVGMWRSSFASTSSGASLGVYFFNDDGTFAAIEYQRKQFNGLKGKYRLSGANLELYDYSWFQKHDNALSFSAMSVSFYRERWDLIKNGTRSELLEIIDPDHEIWKDYGGITGTVGWMDHDNYNDTIEWIDASTFDFVTGLRNPLELVHE